MKRNFVFAVRVFLLVVLAVSATSFIHAQAKVASVEITGATEAVAGQKVKFTATAKDDAGKPLDVKPNLWVALPFDSAVADMDGTVTFFEPGEIKVAAVVGGKPGFVTVIVKPASIAEIDVDPASAQVSVGGTIKLNATPRVSNGNPRGDLPVVWTSTTPRIAAVDAAGFVTGIAPGKATLNATAGSFSKSVT